MAKPTGPRPEIGEFPIDTGTCELEPDPYNSNGWVLRINGVPSSHIDLADPLRLDFEYMRWIASLVDSRWAPSDRLRALHLGGGACSLARRFAASHAKARRGGKPTADETVLQHGEKAGGAANEVLTSRGGCIMRDPRSFHQTGRMA